MEMFLVWSHLPEGLCSSFGHPLSKAGFSTSAPSLKAAGKMVSLHWRQTAALGSVLVATEI